VLARRLLWRNEITPHKIALPVSSRAETTASSREHRPSFSQASLEQIRRREVTRILKKMNPSPEEEEAIERFSHVLVAKLLLGPISEAMTQAETWASQRRR
jgi:glutamyl-tRNA reductase